VSVPRSPQERRRRALRAADREGRSLGDRLDRLDPYWGPQVLILAAILLDLTLSTRVTLGPFWLLPALESLALLGLIGSSTRGLVNHPTRRLVSLALIAVVSAANSVSLILLCKLLIDGGKASGRALIGSGMVLWVTNVLLFAVWFWQLDRGGPIARRMGDPDLPDFMFVQMANKEFARPGWEPRLIDYLYTSFTNATAFSPTDTMPLTVTAKLTMAAQSLTALVTVGLVVARAVNILQ
jgi:hypothetical protein